MGTTSPPGWHRDPADPYRARWWDGEAWTATYQRWDGTQWNPVPAPSLTVDPSAMAAGQTSAEATVHDVPSPFGLDDRQPEGLSGEGGARQAKSGAMMWVIGGAAAALLGLVAAGLFLGPLKSDDADRAATVASNNGGEPATQLATFSNQMVDDFSGVMTSGVIYTDEAGEYDYTQPVISENRAQVAQIELAVSLDDPPAWTGLTREDYDKSWAFRLYADAGFNIPVPLRYGGTGEAYATTNLSPWGGKYAVVADSNGVPDLTSKKYPLYHSTVPEYYGVYWGLRDVYYLVRYVDLRGNKLERPIVSKISFTHTLDTPFVTVGADHEVPGMIRVSWEAVPNATHYRVFRTNYGEKTRGREVLFLAETTDLSWSTAGAAADFLWLDTQNAGLRVGADHFDKLIDWDPYSFGSEVGVIAYTEGDKVISSFGAVDTRATNIGTFPSEFSTAAYRAAVHAMPCWGDDIFIAWYDANPSCGPEDYPKAFPYTSLDGQVRGSLPYVIEVRYFEDDEAYRAGISGQGTYLGFWQELDASTEAEARAWAEAYNADSLGNAVPTGGFVVSSNNEVIERNQPKGDVDPDMLVYANGSNHLVKYIGAHMYAGNTAIDVAEMVDFWGTASILDAADEAYYQNPAAGVVNYEYEPRDDAIYVEYDDRDRITESRAKVSEIVAEIITDGMTDSQKVTSINEYIVDHVEYDYEALTHLRKEKDIEGYEYAWLLSGGVLDGTVVCMGYSQYFLALADAAGLDAVIVNGDVYSGGLHAWNKVNVDGQWKAVDVTWNDPQGDFLMINDGEFEGSAQRGEGVRWIFGNQGKDYATS